MTFFYCTFWRMFDAYSFSRRSIVALLTVTRTVILNFFISDHIGILLLTLSDSTCINFLCGLFLSRVSVLIKSYCCINLNCGAILSGSEGCCKGLLTVMALLHSHVTRARCFVYVSRSVQNSLTEESNQDGTSMKLNTNIILEQ
jgi:hypothetical protein